MKQQTKTHFLIRSLFVAFLVAMSLTSYAQEADIDSTVNVIGWFCKHDTIVYSQREQVFAGMGNDTTMVSDITRRYHIAVIGSIVRCPSSFPTPQVLKTKLSYSWPAVSRA